MSRIACFGDNCVDYYEQSEETYYGGNPVNVAVYTRRLGNEASYIGVVGNDRFGEGMLQALREKGVDVSHVQQKEGSTALTYVQISDGDRIFGDYIEGVMSDYRLRDEDIHFIAKHDLAITGLWGHCEKDLPSLREKGIKIAFDSSDRPEDPVSLQALPYVDIFFFSDDNHPDEELESILQEIAKKGPKIVVATRGAKGSVAYAQSAFIYQGIREVKIADTMGAGDSFIAGFLNAYLKGSSLKECMEAGADCSAVTLSYYGAW